jgi:glycerol-1-phosphate dehydrogenase [NAD(P)+]
MSFSHLPLDELLSDNGFPCSCGRHHTTDVKEVAIGHGVLGQIPVVIKKYGGKQPFLLSDGNTHRAAGEKVEAILREHGMKYISYVFPQQQLEPDEYSVGQTVMNFERDCDFIVAIGSGTINDIAKMLSKVTGLKYIVVGTAPSMDGFASNTSSMISNGIKVTINSACPVAIITDLDIVSQAPLKMIQAGLGDMLAKYISICEWRISHLINGEYYCEEVAALVRRSLERCVQSAGGLEERDPEAIEHMLEGLILSGIAMSFAGISRPASGVEHYFSHIWDMRSLEFGTNSDLHGIQVGIGTVLALKVYEQVLYIKPDKARALAFVKAFDHRAHNDFLKGFLGSSADNLILLEKKEGKYDKAKHLKRLDIILSHWQDILDIIREELPAQADVISLLNDLGAPVDPGFLGFSKKEVRKAFQATKDIRDKYSVSRLLWDIGELDDVTECL